MGERDPDPVDELVREVLVKTVGLLCGLPPADIPGGVSVKYIKGDRMVAYEVGLVRPGDAGAVIGKQGRTIRALRDVLRGVSGAYRRSYTVDLEDDGGRRQRQRKEGES